MSNSRKRDVEHDATQSDPVVQRAVEASPGTAALLRLIWMGPGNLVLLFFGLSIARTPSWTFTWQDVVYWLTIVALIGVRYIDVTRFAGLTTRAEPATLGHVRRYAAMLVAFALIGWLAAQSTMA